MGTSRMTADEGSPADRRVVQHGKCISWMKLLSCATLQTALFFCVFERGCRAASAEAEKQGTGVHRTNDGDDGAFWCASSLCARLVSNSTVPAKMLQQLVVIAGKARWRLPHTTWWLDRAGGVCIVSS